MRISDWSSDVCSSDLGNAVHHRGADRRHAVHLRRRDLLRLPRHGPALTRARSHSPCSSNNSSATRSEEHTSELQSLMRISYAVFCLKKTKTTTTRTTSNDKTTMYRTTIRHTLTNKHQSI